MPFRADRLLRLRSRARLTQQQLADKTSATQRAISHWEREARVPTANNLAELARALNCSADYLLDLTDERIPSLGRMSNEGYLPERIQQPGLAHAFRDLPVDRVRKF